MKQKKRGSASTRVAEALRMAALSLRHTDTALGAYYRHNCPAHCRGRSGVCHGAEIGYPDLLAKS